MVVLYMSYNKLDTFIMYMYSLIGLMAILNVSLCFAVYRTTFNCSLDAWVSFLVILLLILLGLSAVDLNELTSDFQVAVVTNVTSTYM